MLLASLMLAAAPGNELLEPTPGTMWFPSQPTTIRWSTSVCTNHDPDRNAGDGDPGNTLACKAGSQ